MFPFVGLTSILGKDWTRMPPFRVPVANPMLVTGATATGRLNVCPPSSDRAIIISCGAGSARIQVTYISPFGPTTGSEPWLISPGAETLIGGEKVRPPSVDLENRIGSAKEPSGAESKLVHVI